MFTLRFLQRFNSISLLENCKAHPLTSRVLSELDFCGFKTLFSCSAKLEPGTNVTFKLGAKRTNLGKVKLTYGSFRKG